MSLLVIFTNLRPKKSELLARFLANLTNLRSEMNDPIFTNLRPVYVLLEVWVFLQILDQKGVTLLLAFELF